MTPCRNTGTALVPLGDTLLVGVRKGTRAKQVRDLSVPKAPDGEEAPQETVREAYKSAWYLLAISTWSVINAPHHSPRFFQN